MKTGKRKCLVTGATGVVGAPLVAELIRNGHEVKVLVRGAVPEKLFSREIEIVKGDLSSEAALEKACQNVDWIFHLAAKLHVSNPDEKLRREYEETNIGGTQRLISLARANGIEKFIYFSTIHMYGATQKGEVFDETSPINPVGFYSETKAAAEKIVLNAENQKGEKIGVALRLAAVYGSRMKGNYVRLLDALRRNRFFFIGKGDNRRTLIHQEDAARAALLAAEKAKGGEIYNVTDGEVHTLFEIIEKMSRALNRPVPTMHLPVAPFRVSIGIVEDLGKMLRQKTPINRALLDKFLEDIAVSGNKIKNELGFNPAFNLETGWQEAVAGN